MDNMDRTLKGMLSNEKTLADSMLQFNSIQDQINQKLNNSSEWLYKKEEQITKIETEFSKIKKIIK